MGYEGHLMMVLDPAEQRAKVDAAIDLLLQAHAAVGGQIVSAGGTGTHHLLDRVTEVQAGSYALMDTQYAAHGHPFEQACWVVGTVIAVAARHAVADVGLKAMGMDHGNPSIEDGTVWFLSDEHVTFAPNTPRPRRRARPRDAGAHRPDDGDARGRLDPARRRGHRPLADRPPRLVTCQSNANPKPCSGGRGVWRPCPSHLLGRSGPTPTTLLVVTWDATTSEAEGSGGPSICGVLAYADPFRPKLKRRQADHFGGQRAHRRTRLGPSVEHGRRSTRPPEHVLWS